jgi:hypothetical protein
MFAACLNVRARTTIINGEIPSRRLSSRLHTRSKLNFGTCKLGGKTSQKRESMSAEGQKQTSLGLFDCFVSELLNMKRYLQAQLLSRF